MASYVKKLENVENQLKNVNPYWFDARELQGMSHPELIQFLVDQLNDLRNDLENFKSEMQDQIEALYIQLP